MVSNDALQHFYFRGGKWYQELLIMNFPGIRKIFYFTNSPFLALSCGDTIKQLVCAIKYHRKRGIALRHVKNRDARKDMVVRHVWRHLLLPFSLWSWGTKLWWLLGGSQGRGGPADQELGQADELGRRGEISETCCEQNRCVRGSCGII